ncbi:MAG: phenylalanine--tRNA ligase subunit beta [Candidatus Pacebacteria bacterium]|jgi:phenylalanyl-tRNA synthetase beta chain|nr:phenylalanine--tRNA ligase subunit beta [Candidatus Paceibacterota bacterium]
MKISYNWLKSYFKDPLPSPEKLAELFTFRFAEVESIESVGEDTVLDVKVLPDRAHYALCHQGIAIETSAIMGLPLAIPEYVPKIGTDKKVPVNIENSTLCRRYTARYIHNVTVQESPDWLKERLATIGQRPINSIVDVANFIMFDMGQPLHAFDADKVEGTITVRMALSGEQITTLDGKEVLLSPEVLVIADALGPLAIAGIKGGKRAEVDSATKNIILEAAHFDPAYIRKASGILGIRTDSSKRFENEITPEWAAPGSDLTAALIGELSPDSVVGEISDLYTVKDARRTIVFDPAFAVSMLGETIDSATMANIFSALGIVATKKGELYTLAIPPERLDLTTPEDVAEEIGRLYGYENIPPIAPPKLPHALAPLKSIYYEEKIRDALVTEGYSEIFTYSFMKSGVLEIEKSLASDKNFLRAGLRSNMAEALEKNGYNADLLGLDDIKIFEIGKTFNADGEHTKVCVGVRKLKKQKGVTSKTILEEMLAKLPELDLSFSITESGMDTIAEAELSVATLPEALSWGLKPYIQNTVAYKKISSYPFIVRDIAMFVPVDTSEDAIATVLRSEAGELLANLRLFDIFTKTFPDGTQKTSYGFRLVFQSYEKTLSDEEANAIMSGIHATVVTKGWEVR